MRIARRFLLDRRRSFLWWSLAMAMTVAFTVALWPSVRGEQQYEDLLRDLPEAVRALIGAEAGIPFTTPPGYLHSRIFATLLPVLLLVFGIELGARAVGGSEEDGTLELVLAQPVSRRRVLLERYAAVVGLVFGLALVSFVSLVAMGAPVGVLDGVHLVRLALATLAATGLALLYATLAFAVGSVVGRRAPATAAGTCAAVAGYLIRGLSAVTDTADAAQVISPWHWYLDRNLVAETAGFAAVLLPYLLCAVAVAAGCARFVRRDLRLP